MWISQNLTIPTPARPPQLVPVFDDEVNEREEILVMVHASSSCSTCKGTCTCTYMYIPSIHQMLSCAIYVFISHHEAFRNSKDSTKLIAGAIRTAGSDFYRKLKLKLPLFPDPMHIFLYFPSDCYPVTPSEITHICTQR